MHMHSSPPRLEPPDEFATSQQAPTLWCCVPAMPRGGGDRVALRSGASLHASEVGSYLRLGAIFEVAEEQHGPDGVIFLRLACSQGWVPDRLPGIGMLCHRHEALPPVPGEDDQVSQVPNTVRPGLLRPTERAAIPDTSPRTTPVDESACTELEDGRLSLASIREDESPIVLMPESANGSLAGSSNAGHSSMVARSQRPDFSGKWMMVRLEGDVNSFMKELGIGWALRRAAAVRGYGIHLTCHELQQDGDKLTAITQNARGSFCRELLIDGTDQLDNDPVDGKVIVLTPTWDNVTIQVKARCEKPPRQLPTTRRYLLGKEMVLEQLSPNGIVVKRYFQRIELPATMV